MRDIKSVEKDINDQLARPFEQMWLEQDGSAGTRVGQEIDLQGAYALSRQIQVTAGMGHIFPGEFLKGTTPGKGYTYPFVMLNYTF